MAQRSPIRRLAGALLTASALAAVHPALAAGGEVVEQGVTHQLVTAQKLPNVPGDSFTAVRVDLAPGALSPSHRHPGFVFAYVLSGTVRSQLGNGPAVDYHAGQSWVEPPGTLHTLTQNPSAAEAASLLAVWVAPDGAKLVVPPDSK